MELARQQEHRKGRQARHDEPVADVQRFFENLRDFRRFRDGTDQIDRAVEKRVGDPEADREKGNELDHRLGCDRQHQPFLMLRRINVSCPERPAEDGHAEGNQQGDVIEHRREDVTGGNQRADHGGDRQRHGFQLQGDVGNDANDRNQCGKCCDRLALAVPRTDEIGDRRDAFCLGDLDDPLQQRVSERENNQGADIDGQEFDARPAGIAD